MIKADAWREIHSWFRLKETKKSIARAVGLSIQTVRKILSQAAPRPYCRRPAPGMLLARFREYILQRLAAVGYCAQAVFEELQGRGYRGGYDTVRRFVGPLRKEANIEATVRFETPPGRQGQAD
jgi:transposase